MVRKEIIIGNKKINIESIKKNLDFYRIERCSKCGADRIFLITKYGLRQKSVRSKKGVCKKHKWDYVYQYLTKKINERYVDFGRTSVDVLNSEGEQNE